MQQTSRGVFGRNVAQILRTQGKRHSDLAARLEVTPQAVSMKLSGKRPFSLSEVAVVADFLGVAPGELFEAPTAGVRS